MNRVCVLKTQSDFHSPVPSVNAVYVSPLACFAHSATFHHTPLSIKCIANLCQDTTELRLLAALAVSSKLPWLWRLLIKCLKVFSLQPSVMVFAAFKCAFPFLSSQHISLSWQYILLRVPVAKLCSTSEGSTRQ